MSILRWLAKAAFEDGRWHKLSPNERKHTLLKFADLLEEHTVELAVIESLDSGKPVSECQLTDVPEMIHTIRWHAELIDKIYDNTAPVGSDTLSLVVREALSGWSGIAVEFPIAHAGLENCASIGSGLFGGHQTC
jgi:gamma-glutamyl-gamma-aminobutyraldehyde dehydrogenase